MLRERCRLKTRRLLLLVLLGLMVLLLSAIRIRRAHLHLQSRTGSASGNGRRRCSACVERVQIAAEGVGLVAIANRAGAAESWKSLGLALLNRNGVGFGGKRSV